MNASNRNVASGDLLVNIRREMARAERSNSDLAVVLVRLPHHDESARRRRRLTDYASRLVRASDTICWYDERHFALLLPDTPEDGAERVISRIRDAGPSQSVTEEIRVFSFPRTNDVEEQIMSYAQVVN